MLVLKLSWKRPVIAFYKERNEQPEREAFVVVKTIKELSVSKIEQKEARFEGRLEGFFPLMGDLDYVSSKEGLADRYVLCWFDDECADFDKSMRRLGGVTFSSGTKLAVDNKGKRTYSAVFKAKYGILE